MYKHKKHLFFDLDHTLWDFDKNSAYAFDKIFKEQGFSISLEDFLEHYIPRNQHYWKLYQVNQISHEDLRYYRLKDVFDVLNFDVSDKIIHQLSDDYIKYLPEFNYLFEGAIELLEYLKPNYQLHIITNGFSHVQDKKLNNSKIGHYFKTITNSELAGQKKPSPIIFDYALNMAKAFKEESIMIGDSYEADIEGAIGFGIDAIFFTNNTAKINSNVHQINHLLDLKKIL